MRHKRYLNNIAGFVAKPSEDEVNGFFEANRQNFRLPETVHAAHIIKHVNEAHSEQSARAGIERAQFDLDGGVPFAEAADLHSDCKGNGGDLGSFPRGVMVQEFEDVVFALAPGERSPIFRTPFGFHIAVVIAREAAGEAALNAVRADITSFLLTTRQQQAIRSALTILRSRATIERVVGTAPGEARVQAE